MLGDSNGDGLMDLAISVHNGFTGSDRDLIYLGGTTAPSAPSVSIDLVHNWQHPRF